MLTESSPSAAQNRFLVVGKSQWYITAMERLVVVVQELSHARALEEVAQIVRRAARELTGADGATFVLREGDNCFYADENAISPLWKGKRFPMSQCISGWVMMNARHVVIEDIYKDPRIPAEAYRPTFVKSLAMVPIRIENPIGAIGNYWARTRLPTEDEIAILQALANVTSIALENVDLYARLKAKVKALEESNYDLARFAWSASHDLKAPLQAIDDLSCWIEEDKNNQLGKESREYLETMRKRVRRMEKLLDDILDFSTVEKKLLIDDLGELIPCIKLLDECRALVRLPPEFMLRVSSEVEGIKVPRMPLLRVFCNLIDNAVRHHDRSIGEIWIDVVEENGNYIFAVRDDGPGIPDNAKSRVFDILRKLSPNSVMEGSGMGLPIVRKMLRLYGGDISVEDAPGRGAIFKFTWPKNPKRDYRPA